MKKYLYTIFGLVLGLGVTATLAAPTYTTMRTVLPELTDTYDLGSTTRQWLNIFTNNLRVSSVTSTLIATDGLGNIIATSTPRQTTSSDIIHNNTTGLQGGNGDYYHSNQPINTTSSVTFASVTSSAFYDGSITPGQCVQVGTDGRLTGAGASCATTSSAPETDPIWSAVSSSYLTVADATATYLTQATAASTYLTQANAASTYLAINAASTTLWDAAYLWGDHSSVGYLTTSSNLTVANFASPNISQWTNDAGYLTSYVETDPVFMAASTSLPYQPIGSYLTVESDPIWTATSSNYLTKTEASSTYFKISSWLAQTTDNLAEGITNLYFTIARARESISSLIPAITYSTSTGQLSLTSGYEIPLSASTTNWNNAYNTVNSSSTFWDTAYSWGNHALAGYLTKISGLNISLLNNDVGYITTTPAETDPVWSAVSTTVPYLSANNIFTGSNTFATITIPIISSVLATNDLGQIVATSAPSISGYVPYTGAVADVDLGVYSLTANSVRLISSGYVDDSLEGAILAFGNSDDTESKFYANVYQPTENTILYTTLETPSLNLQSSTTFRFYGKNFINGLNINYTKEDSDKGIFIAGENISLTSVTSSSVYLSTIIGKNITSTEDSLSIGQDIETNYGFSFGLDIVNSGSLLLGRYLSGNGSIFGGFSISQDGSTGRGTALGRDLTVGESSVSIGSSANSTGDYSIAIGNNVTSTNLYAVSIGSDLTVAGYRSLGIGGIGNMTNGTSSSIVGGQYNTNNGERSNISGGQMNTIQAGAADAWIAGSSYSSILSGSSNSYLSGTSYSQILGVNSLIIGGMGGYASGTYIGIFNSVNTTSTGSLSSAFSSINSTASGDRSLVLSSDSVSASGIGASIIVGLNCSANGYGSSIINSNNCSANGYGSSMFSSQYTSVNATGSMAFGSTGSAVNGYGASVYNTLSVTNSSDLSMVLDSQYSIISSTAAFSFMANASNTAIYSPRSVVIGGDDNVMSGAYGMILSGQRNTVSGMFSYAMGSDMTVSSPNSFGINLSPYYSPTSYTLAQTSTMAIMGGRVGIGTTTPEDDLVIDNGITLEDDNYYYNNSKYGHRAYLSAIDATLYSSVYGYASTTQATDTEPFNNIGVFGEGQGVWDVGVAGFNFGNGAAGIFANADKTAPTLLIINAEAAGNAIVVQSGSVLLGGDLQVNGITTLTNITSCGTLGTDENGAIVCNDLGSMGATDVADQVLDRIKRMSFWEKILLLFF